MEFCLGTVQMGMQYGIQNNGRPSGDETIKIISSALENGICWFDTAAAYGNAEEVLGRYIADHLDKADQMRVVSKLAPDAFADVPRHWWRDIALRHVQETLRRLHKQQLDVYMFHNASYIFDQEAVKALDSVRQKGLARTIGVSIYTPEEAVRALSYPEIGAIQIPYNVFDQRLDQCGFFEKAREKNIRIYARSTLLQGLAVMKEESLPPHMKFASPYIARFHAICARNDISPLQGTIGFVLNHPDIQYLVFGVDNQRQLLEYISVSSERLPPRALNELNQAFDTVEERLVNPSLWNK